MRRWTIWSSASRTGRGQITVRAALRGTLTQPPWWTSAVSARPIKRPSIIYGRNSRLNVRGVVWKRIVVLLRRSLAITSRTRNIILRNAKNVQIRTRKFARASVPSKECVMKAPRRFSAACLGHPAATPRIAAVVRAAMQTSVQASVSSRKRSHPKPRSISSMVSCTSGPIIRVCTTSIRSPVLCITRAMAWRLKARTHSRSTIFTAILAAPLRP